MKKIVAILLALVLCLSMVSALADEEHVLRICTPNSDGLQSIYPLFEETTGIKVISESLGTGDCMTKIRAEIEQEYCSFDLMYGGSLANCVANFIGHSNTIEAQADTAAGTLSFANGFKMDYTHFIPSAQSGSVKVSVRPEELVIRGENEAGIDAVVKSSIFLGLNTTYFVELFDGSIAEIVEESSISNIIPNGTRIRLGLKEEKINVLTADGSANLTEGVQDDAH